MTAQQCTNMKPWQAAKQTSKTGRDGIRTRTHQDSPTGVKQRCLACSCDSICECRLLSVGDRACREIVHGAESLSDAGINTERIFLLLERCCALHIVVRSGDCTRFTTNISAAHVTVVKCVEKLWLGHKLQGTKVYLAYLSLCVSLLADCVRISNVSSVHRLFLTVLRREHRVFRNSHAVCWIAWLVML